MPSAVRYRHDDEGISLEGRGRKHKAHASLRKRDKGSSRSSHSHSRSHHSRSSRKHGSHKSKHYYSDTDSDSLSAAPTLYDPPSSYSDDSSSYTSSSDGTLVGSEASSAGILTRLRGKRGKSDESRKDRSRRSHKIDRSEKSVTTWRPSRHDRGGAGIREAFSLAAGLYGTFRHVQDRIRGEHTSKLHRALFHFGWGESMHRRNVRVRRGVRDGIRDDYDKKPHGKPRKSYRE